MGFRFQRSVRIVKGVRLNISKSGLGVSVGPRGAKLTIGPSGTHVHAGLPGTGLYHRQKIGGSSGDGYASAGRSASSAPDSWDDIEIHIDDETGDETIRFLDNGRDVTDDSLLRRAMRDSTFKETLQRTREQVVDQVREESDLLTAIHAHAEPLTDWESVARELDEARLELYTRREFQEAEPDKGAVKIELEAEARREVRPLFSRKRRRQEFVEARLDNLHHELVHQWNKRKQDFENAESRRESEENARREEAFMQWTGRMNRLLNPDVPHIEERLDDLFAGVELPVEFSVSYDVRNGGSEVMLDVDLPEIEDFPRYRARILSTGKVSIKEKSQREKMSDYQQAIAGIGIYFASLAFSAAPTIDNVVVSGYTQRINSATGRVRDDYVYSVIFDKEGFGRLVFERLNPVDAMRSFRHRARILKSGAMKRIEAFA